MSNLYTEFLKNLFQVARNYSLQCPQCTEQYGQCPVQCTAISIENSPSDRDCNLIEVFIILKY